MLSFGNTALTLHPESFCRIWHRSHFWQEMEVLLQNETGLAMADFNHRIGWYYLPTYGAFAKEVSDTNFKQIEVQDVYYNKAADAYSVLYRTPGIMDEDGEEGLYRVTLKQAGDHWQIMANTEI